MAAPPDIDDLISDVAAVVADKLGVVCHTYFCDPEPGVALVKFDEEDMLSFDEADGGTFEFPMCWVTVTLFASGADRRGGIGWLLEQTSALRTIRGEALAGGGTCPPVESVSGLRAVAESNSLLAVEAALAPVHVTL